MAIPTKIFERISSGVKKFQPILTSAKARDVNESDTVVIITDLLSEVFGYDKYSEITTKHIIKKTFCDLAIKIDGKVNSDRDKSHRARIERRLYQASYRLRSKFWNRMGNLDKWDELANI